MTEDEKEVTNGTPEDPQDSPETPETPETQETAQESLKGEEDSEAEDVNFEEQAAEFKDKLLRAMAESENVRRRAERDKEHAAKYAIANFAREMLQVNDNLRRALESVDAESRKNNEAVENLAVGVEMTERAMLSAFERAGIKAIDALGQKFDPHFHEAMFEIEDINQPAGTVTQVIEPGYVIYNRPLRPARVGISKGGPKTVPETDSDADPETDDSATASSEPQTKGQTAYEKQIDAREGASGSQLNEEL